MIATDTQVLNMDPTKMRLAVEAEIEREKNEHASNTKMETPGFILSHTGAISFTITQRKHGTSGLGIIGKRISLMK